MKASEITVLVTESALRFGDRNPQQLAQLNSRLGKASQTEVAQGLLQVFAQGATSSVQELAGVLLASLCPKTEIDLKTLLRASLADYELSVEQFPQYLCSLLGSEQLLFVIQELEGESLSKQELRALQTMRFWLGVQATGHQNGG